MDLERIHYLTSYRHWLEWAKERSFARWDISGYMLSVPASGTAAITLAMPNGWGWLPHCESYFTEAAGILEVVCLRDGEIYLNVPALPLAIDLNWNMTIPWLGAGIIKNRITVTYTNTDTSDRFVICVFQATLIRLAEWDRFLRRVVGNYDSCLVAEGVS